VSLGKWGGRVEGEYVEKGGRGGRRGLYMLRRCKRCWLCMKFELPSLSAMVFLIGVLPPSFLALSVNLIGPLCLADSVFLFKS
jgi:hypothetical protein